MNFLLCLILVIVGAGAYYEYDHEQRTSAGFDHQLSVEQQQVETLRATNQKLQDEKSHLTSNIADAQIQMVSLNTRLASEQKSSAPAPLTTAPPASQPNSNNLGTIVTLTGSTYQNCLLLKVEPDGITFNHSQGITKVPFSFLTPDLQKRFGFDPQKEASLDEDTVRYQEQLRQAAAAQPGGTPSP
jgi:hypothetical protein